MFSDEGLLYASRMDGYWKEVHAEALRRMRENGLLEWKRLSLSVGIPLISGVVQWRTGVTLPVNLAVNIGSGLTLYTILAFFERYRLTCKVVEERDAAQRGIICERDATIVRLSQPQLRNYSARIEQFVFGDYKPTLGQFVVSVLVEIRSLGAPSTTMHDFKLWLVDQNLCAGSASHIMNIPTGELIKRRFEFVPSGIDAASAAKIGKASKWKVTFKDVHDKEYETPIYEHSH